MPITKHNGLFKRIGMVARWRPVHLGHIPVLQALCDCAAHAFIGIGSANRYDFRNPFTLEETTAMLQLALAGHENYTILPVKDLDDGPRWRIMIKEMFGPLDRFVTANPYVANLLLEDYHVIKPITLIADEAKIAVDGAIVRNAMAHGSGWQALLPPQIAAYITENKLDERFRREFGLQTLALESVLT